MIYEQVAYARIYTCIEFPSSHIKTTSDSNANTCDNRQDTANAVTHLAHLIRNPENKLPLELRLLDLCTGSGCIPLLFGHELRHTRRDVDYRMLGVDISPEALKLAEENLARLQRMPSRSNMFNKPSKVIGYGNQGGPSGQEGQGQGTKVEAEGKVTSHFLQANILRSPFDPHPRDSQIRALEVALNLGGYPHLWDIVISNPPYISPAAYWKTTMRSVRGFEPRLALVPPGLPPGASPDMSARSHPDFLKTVENPSCLSPLPLPFKGSILDPSISTFDPSTIVPVELPGTDTSDTKLRHDQHQSDQFYPAILAVANRAEAKVVLLEVADEEQAVRVARFGKNMAYDGVEIWREQPDAVSPSAFAYENSNESGSREEDSVSGIPIIGTGNPRSVVFWRGAGAAWLGKKRV